MQLKMEMKEGVFLVDKPQGVSSHTVVNWARRLFGVKKVGHTGTLDPLATGLLILLIGKKYTRLQEHYLKLDKEYICTAQLGVETDTYDSDGKVIAQANWDTVAQISRQHIEKKLFGFLGETSQIVPGFSAVRVNGRKLYALIRNAQHANKDVSEILQNLPVRTVLIKELKLLNYSLDEKKQESLFTIQVSCGSGTYIRSLVHDIGQLLGVGATVVALRRTRIGEFSIEQAMMCPLIQQKLVSLAR